MGRAAANNGRCNCEAARTPCASRPASPVGPRPAAPRRPGPSGSLPNTTVERLSRVVTIGRDGRFAPAPLGKAPRAGGSSVTSTRQRVTIFIAGRPGLSRAVVKGRPARVNRSRRDLAHGASILLNTADQHFAVARGGGDHPARIDTPCEADTPTVTRNIPDYLKLHVEDQADPRPALDEVQGLEVVCRAFQTATGWQLGFGPPPAHPAGAAASTPESHDPGARHQLWLIPAETGLTATPLESVRPLANAIGHLLDDMLTAHMTVWQREAELAAGIPVTLRPDEQQTLARRLESVLQGGAEAIGCQAAALYLLDDATTYLKLRTAWGLPKHRFLDEPRPLRGSVADLEALIGHAVALEDAAALPHWKMPENFPAALCVPVSTTSTPLGTLWFFANRVRDFTPEQVHVAEIVAGRLVSDLEREVLVREGWRQHQSDAAQQALLTWQREQHPRVPPLVDGWQVAAWTPQTDAVAARFHDWCILPDGRLAVAVGEAEGPRLDAALTVTTLQLALRTHANYPHLPRQMLDRLNESLWTHSPGNRQASLFYAAVDPDSGTMHYSSAGEIQGLLREGNSPISLADDNPLLGYDPDHRYRESAQVIAPGQSLVLFTRAHQNPLDEDLFEPDECRIALLLRTLENATAEEQARAVAQELQVASPEPRTVLVVRRIF